MTSNDGDQVTLRIQFTQESNAELEELRKKPSYYIDNAGKNIRKVESEPYQTFFVMTKDPDEKSRILTKEEKDYFVKMDPMEITFSLLVKWFGKTYKSSTKQVEGPKYRCTDIITLTNKECKNIKEGESVKTTLGRFVFNKIIIERCGLIGLLPYNNKVMRAGDYGKFEDSVTKLLEDEKINTETFVKYLDTRDWLGYQLHGVITNSFSPKVIKTPSSVKKLREELFKKYEKELSLGDTAVMQKVEDELIKASLKEMEGDYGYELYDSGARGSVSNNYKNMYLTRGSVKNDLTGKYDIIKNSLADGLPKEGIPANANVITQGAYPKTVETKDSGYLAKQILAALQSEVLADKDSDCGSIRYEEIALSEKNYWMFRYRYIKVGNSLVVLNDTNKDKYIGKVVKMRSPLYCVGIGKERKLCNKCAGDFYYKLQKKNIGLAAGKLGTAFTRLNMKKFHDNVIKTERLDVNDLLI